MQIADIKSTLTVVINENTQKIQENEKFVVDEIKLINQNIGPAIEEHVGCRLGQVEDRNRSHIENQVNEMAAQKSQKEEE